MASKSEIKRVNIEVQADPRLSRFLSKRKLDFSDYENGFRSQSFSQMAEIEIEYIDMMLTFSRLQESQHQNLKDGVSNFLDSLNGLQELAK